MIRTAASNRRSPAHVEPLESRVLLTASELIRNGSFEGAVGSEWVRSGQLQADSRFSNVHSGLGYAYLADASGNAANSISGSMYQDVTIPPSSTALTLTFWTKITTTETSGQNDLLTVKVTDSSGANVLQNVATLSNLNSSSSYIQRTYALSNSLKGQTVRILFSASNNATNATTFRIDDVGLSYNPTPSAMRVVGYFPGIWSQRNQIDFNQLTWVNYFSIAVNTDGTLNTANVSDSHLADIVAIAHPKGIGVSITVGPQAFSTVAASSSARTIFANQILTYMQQRNLDGVDIDWEPPATGSDQANYALMIDSLYAVLHPFGYNITAATNPWTKEIPVAATNEMDWVNVMCYDFDYANHSTYAAATDGMNQWATYGVEKKKLVMGVPFYGRYGTSWSDTHAKTYGTIVSDYKAVTGNDLPPDVDSYTDLSGHVTYFNGVTTMEKKMAFIRDNAFGGAMIWQLGQDHWDANLKYDTFSLLPIIGSMLRPPSWLTPASGSMFDLVNKSFVAASGNVTFSGNVAASLSGLSLTINNNASVVLGMTQKIGVLLIASSGKLDLRDKSLIIDYTGGASPIGSWNGSAYTGVTGLVASGYAGGTWTGSGIVTSMSSALAPNSLTTIGCAEASSTLGISGTQTAVFGGQTVDATSVVLKYTYAGDANLDGTITGDDYFAIDNAFPQHLHGWQNGDFNFDGVIDGDDYFLIDSNFPAQGAPL